MFARTHDSITTCVTQPFRLDSNCCRAGRRFQRLRALTYNLCNTDKELQSGIAQTCRQHRRCPKMRTPASSVSGLFVSLWVSLRLPLGVSSPPSGCLFVSLWVSLRLPLGVSSSPSGCLFASLWVSLRLPLGRSMGRSKAGVGTSTHTYGHRHRGRGRGKNKTEGERDTEMGQREMGRGGDMTPRERRSKSDGYTQAIQERHARQRGLDTKERQKQRGLKRGRGKEGLTLYDVHTPSPKPQILSPQPQTVNRQP
jgi:hypothetical protein